MVKVCPLRKANGHPSKVHESSAELAAYTRQGTPLSPMMVQSDRGTQHPTKVTPTIDWLLYIFLQHKVK